MGNTKSQENQAASNELSHPTRDSYESAAEKYSAKAENSRKKKKITKIGGGVTSGVLMGAGMAAGGTAGTIAVSGTIASVLVGIPTLGVGLLVGLAATAATAGVAAGTVGIVGAAATHFIAKHYEDDESTFREIQEDLLTNYASTRHDVVANESIADRNSISLVELESDSDSDSDSASIAELPQAPPMNKATAERPQAPPMIKATAELPQAPPMNKATAEPPQVAQNQPTCICLDVSSTPTLKDVFQLVVVRVAAKWEAVAICLGIDACVIRNISRNHPSDCERACTDMLDRWLSRNNHTGDQERTWSTLLTALKNANANFVCLAQDLQRVH